MVQPIQDFYAKLNFKIRIDTYTPERSAPICANHDSPAYSDSGDDEYLEFTVFLKDHRGMLVELDHPDFAKTLYAKLYDKVMELAREEYEDNQKGGEL